MTAAQLVFTSILWSLHVKCPFDPPNIGSDGTDLDTRRTVEAR
jgi:hypothetical protein